MLRRIFLLLVSLLPLAAQNASITGTITDPQQAPVPNVPVTLTNIDTGVTVSARTDGEGNYEFPFVPPGNYRVKAAQPGFRTVEQGPMKIEVAQRTRVNMQLELGETSSTVSVEGGVV